jgi:hypothetical protein
MTEDQKDEIRAIVREVLAETGMPAASVPNLFGVPTRARRGTIAILADAEQRGGDAQ